MGLLDLFRKREKEENEVAVPLDRDKDGNEIYKDDIIGYIEKELERRKGDRKPLELQWILNSNFLNGNQYCDINPTSGMIEEYMPKDDYSEREIFNRIAPLMDTRLANLKTVDYDMTVLPRTNELDDYEKAKISTELLRYTQVSSHFNRKKDTLIEWAELCGTAFLMSWWDDSKGRERARIIVEADGVTSERVLTEGDISYGLLTAFEVYPENIFKQDVGDQRSIIVEQVLTTEDVYDLYGVEVEGGSVDAFTLAPTSITGGHGYPASAMSITTKTVEDAVYVRTYFERKSRRYPDGRCAVVAGKELIYYGKLPTDTIPIVAVRSKNVQGRFFGRSPIEDLIPLQRTYNGIKNKIHDYAKTLASNKLIIEEGSVDLDWWEEGGAAPGVPLVYKQGYDKPTLMQPSPLPSAIFEDLMQTERDMEYVANVSQLSAAGSAPTGVTSGTAINNIRQIDNTRMSLTAENIREGVLDVAKQWLHLYKKHATGYRVLNICGGNESGAVLTWCSEDINSYDIEYTTENSLTNTPESKRELLLQAYQLGLLNDEDGGVSRDMKRKLLEAMKVNIATGTASVDELQTQFAARENSYFKAGVIPKVSEYDDHDIHKSEHMRFLLQNEFRMLAKRSPEMAEAFKRHIAEHENQIRQEAQNAAMTAQLQNLNGGKR